MSFDRLARADWDDRLRNGMVDFFNYFLSGGFNHGAVSDAHSAFELAEKYIDFDSAARNRQEELGGILSDDEQLERVLGVAGETLERIAFSVNEMNLDNLSLLAPQTTFGNSVEAFVNGPDCLAVLLEEIALAERYIHCSVMLFYNDKSGEKVTQALLDALARGVVIRLMVDYTLTALGYDHNLKFGEFGKLADRLVAAGALVQNTFESSYADEKWPEIREELARKGVPENYLYIQDFVQKQTESRLNIINHRKFMVVDEHTLVLGSINVGDQYLGDSPLRTPGNVEIGGRMMGIPGDPKEWHDGCFRIRGAAARTANRIFAAQWTVIGGDVFDPTDKFYSPPMADLRFGEEQCTLFASFAGNPVNSIQHYHLSLLKYAGDETVIVNPYLIDEAFWEMLESLDKDRARHVSICNPLSVNDHPTNRAAVRSHMYGPFEKGVTFHDYSETERFSHWKIAYDRRGDAVFHGSYNLNERSACHDFELGILVKGKNFADKARRMIGYDLTVSRKATDASEFFKHPAWHPSTYVNKWTKSVT